jgi:hypothetical protein
MRRATAASHGAAWLARGSPCRRASEHPPAMLAGYSAFQASTAMGTDTSFAMC